MNTASDKLYRTAFRLAILTIVYNLIEGTVAVFFGHRDDSLTLFGFGIDSFIEVISGVGIASMVVRIRQAPESQRGGFERTALRITGTAFYVLVVGLIVSSIQKVITGEKPETTLAGVVLSVVSIGAMLFLMRSKLAVGKALDSAPIISDAHCTKVCVYMSIVLLVASAVYELTRVAYVDILGSLGLAYLSFKEGREAFEKANHTRDCACGND